MKTIINIDILGVDFPALVTFFYSEIEGHVTNVHKIELLADGYQPSNIITIYYLSDEIRQTINEELDDKYKRGEYEEA